MADFKKRVFWHFTFKDILTIISSVAIPIALAIYTAIGFQQQKQQAEKKQKFDFQQSTQLRQQSLYDEFLNNIYKLDKDGYLNDTKNPWAFANAYYRAAHRQLDTIRKADVLQFVKEKQLIGRNNCTNGCRTTKLDDIIRLNELNFDNVHLASETGVLNKLNLQCVSFNQVSMSNAIFSFASLNGVSFDGGRLHNVKFDDSSLLCTSFNRVNLSGADFGNSNLAGAHFSNSEMTGARVTKDQMKQASFDNVIMPNGRKSATTSSATTKKSITQTATILKTEMSATTTITSSLTSSSSSLSSTTSSTTTPSSSITTTTLTTTSTTSTTTTTTSTTTASSSSTTTASSSSTTTTTISSTTTTTTTISSSTTTTTTSRTAVPTCSPSVCCSAASCTTCVYSSTTDYCLLYSNPPGYNLYTSASSCASDGGADIYCNYNTTCGIGAGTPGLGSGNGCK
ncbi:unnamed protein product [Adineta steineri]|uniref:Pentapeptide repeat-containing protein n=1 Tax=Adineta steineri TaxID=433720 RepID=A0A814V4L8_9BILA|nr:unnamed protein product [Adineta steineri]CAF3678756.1 unnamed protein product [Adineta steineri]